MEIDHLYYGECPCSEDFIDCPNYKDAGVDFIDCPNYKEKEGYDDTHNTKWIKRPIIGV